MFCSALPIDRLLEIAEARIRELCALMIAECGRNAFADDLLRILALSNAVPSTELEIPDALPVSWRGLQDACLELVAAKSLLDRSEGDRRKDIAGCLAAITMARTIALWAQRSPTEWRRELEGLKLREEKGDPEPFIRSYRRRVASSTWKAWPAIDVDRRVRRIRARLRTRAQELPYPIESRRGLCPTATRFQPTRASQLTGRARTRSRSSRTAAEEKGSGSLRPKWCAAFPRTYAMACTSSVGVRSRREW